MLDIVVKLKIRPQHRHFESDTVHNLRFTGVAKSNQKISRASHLRKRCNSPTSFRKTILLPAVKVCEPCLRTQRHKDVITNITMAPPLCPAVTSLLLFGSFQAWEKFKEELEGLNNQVLAQIEIQFTCP